MKIFSFIISNELNAGPKAPRDIIQIVQKNYYAKSKVYLCSDSKFRRFQERIKKLYLLYFILLGNRELSIIQYPFIKSKKIVKKLGKGNILLIHDLNSIRYHRGDETDVLDSYRYIIVHNERMKQYLIERGIDSKKLFVLELFDYCCNFEASKNTKEVDFKQLKIVFAGNLIPAKAPFLYQLDSKKMNYILNVYGVGIQDDINEKIKYKGSFLPEELPSNLDGNLGLVWDGNKDETDENEGFKNYTKYNNPHKLSCYLAADLPVIVWKKAAIADFVQKYNVGYVINDVEEISTLDFSDYFEKKQNAKKIGERVRNGFYTKRVLDVILNQIDHREKE